MKNLKQAYLTQPAGVSVHPKKKGFHQLLSFADCHDYHSEDFLSEQSKGLFGKWDYCLKRKNLDTFF